MRNVSNCFSLIFFKFEIIFPQEKTSIEEICDYGYVTQGEHQESISTSSNEEEQAVKKPQHQKHSFSKYKHNNAKIRNAGIVDKKELRRKELVKRSKTNALVVPCL